MTRILEQYFTPEKFVSVLFDTLRAYNFESRLIVEPCVGEGAIASRFPAGAQVITNDIDDTFEADFNLDAALPETWEEIGPCDWVITNPPFSKAFDILQHGLANATTGVALLVRLSFLEPTFDRQEFLIANPPSQMVVLPRHSFTGDGKSDSVTCAWLIWEKHAKRPSGISILRKLPAPERPRKTKAESAPKKRRKKGEK